MQKSVQVIDDSQLHFLAFIPLSSIITVYEKNPCSHHGRRWTRPYFWSAACFLPSCSFASGKLIMSEITNAFQRAVWGFGDIILSVLACLCFFLLNVFCCPFLQEKCHQYWPAERSARYQYFVVDPMAEYNMPQYILREFKVTDARVRWIYSTLTGSPPTLMSVFVCVGEDWLAL